MIKDIIDSVVKELQNEKHVEKIYVNAEPYLTSIKLYFYTIVFLMVLMTGALINLNMILIIKNKLIN